MSRITRTTECSPTISRCRSLADRDPNCRCDAHPDYCYCDCDANADLYCIAWTRTYCGKQEDIELERAPNATASATITIHNTGTGPLTANVTAPKHSPPFAELGGGNGIMIGPAAPTT